MLACGWHVPGLKTLKTYLQNQWNVLTRVHRKKKGQILYIAGRGIQIATSAKLLDIMSLVDSLLI